MYAYIRTQINRFKWSNLVKPRICHPAAVKHRKLFTVYGTTVLDLKPYGCFNQTRFTLLPVWLEQLQQYYYKPIIKKFLNTTIGIMQRCLFKPTNLKSKKTDEISSYESYNHLDATAHIPISVRSIANDISLFQLPSVLPCKCTLTMVNVKFELQPKQAAYIG